MCHFWRACELMCANAKHLKTEPTELAKTQ